ncbi:hypothetical protein QA646_29025 (plasmid) [Rhizobium sp. CB3090]|uniref:hypothetical protein n=1 Tax=Rhizobium sp. CB3090 TaxID=3039156 RepID=UPI0024B093AF|nr:hypothetical protein [Rhizobium sp. CB3090]WFU12928.1 hypothetical protein QA646_29025 [Rhizobium sp. CB3090]
MPEVGHPSAKAQGQTNAGNDVAGKRATVKIGMTNTAYNMLRYVFHEERRAAA